LWVGVTAAYDLYCSFKSIGKSWKNKRAAKGAEEPAAEIKTAPQAETGAQFSMQPAAPEFNKISGRKQKKNLSPPQPGKTQTPAPDAG
jgi:hypothetical protein